MKALSPILALTAIGFSPIFAQDFNPCNENVTLTGGTEVKVSTTDQSTGAISGTDYEYELWHNSNQSKNEVKMKYYGASQGGGAAFRGEWNEPNTKFDYLARVGFKFEKNGKNSGSFYEDYGYIYADYNYNRSERLDGDNYSYIGIYGWARAGNDANLVEFYIVDDWWGNRHQGDNTPVGAGTVCNNECSAITPDVSIDGGTYKVYKNTRTNEPSIEGNSTFDQYFSIRQTPRKCGTISITEHFKAWENKGLKLGKLYEAKILAEVGAYDVYAQSTVTSGWIDYKYAAMRTTKTPESQPGTGGEGCITLPASPPTAEQDPYDVCFIYPGENPSYIGKCYVCIPDNEEGEYDCRTDWVWSGGQPYLDDNLDAGYWYREVQCRTGSTPILTHNPTNLMPQTLFSIKYYTLKGEPLGSKLPSKSGVYIAREGYSIKKIAVK